MTFSHTLKGVKNRLYQFWEEHDLLEWTKSFFKSFWWVLLVVIFGLLQLWVTLSWCFIRVDFPIPEGKIFADGILIFFSTALIASITIDYHLSKPIQLRLNRMSRYLTSLLFTFIPMILIAISVGVYSASVNVSLESINPNNANFYQYMITVTATLHALISKTLIFKVEQ